MSVIDAFGRNSQSLYLEQDSNIQSVNPLPPAPLPTELQLIPNNKSKMGSVFTLNNTSYSGADIKLVVHMYNQELVSDTLEKLNGADQMQEELNNIVRQIALLEKKQVEYKQGTPEKDRNKEELSKLVAQQTKLSMNINAEINNATYKSKDLITSTKVLANVQTLSLSVFRDKKTIRSFGSVAPKGYTRGPREISGTIVFTVFDEHVLYQFLNSNKNDVDPFIGNVPVLLDQLPPVDITISFANEYGQTSRMGISGVEFVDEGQVMSIEDILTESTVTFVARDFDPMRSVYQRKLDEQGRLMQDFLGKRASSLILEEDYKKIKGAINPFSKFRQRRTPFL